MNREFKFRFWDTEEKKFIRVDGFIPQLDINEMFEWCEKAGVIPQQYTGLKDKYGKEIYEGDIIDNNEEYNNIKVVNYDPHSCYYCLMDIEEWPDYIYNGEMFNEPGEGSNFSSRIEIVGNINE